MTKQKKHIDDFFKEHLNDSSLPLSGGEWDAIAKELHPKKKRFFWWIWLLASLVTGAAIFYFTTATGFSSRSLNSATNDSSLTIKNLDTQALTIIDLESNTKSLSHDSISKDVSVISEKPNILEKKRHDIDAKGENLTLFSRKLEAHSIDKEFDGQSKNYLPERYISLRNMVLSSKQNKIPLTPLDYFSPESIEFLIDSSKTKDNPSISNTPKNAPKLLSNIQVGITVNGNINNQNLQSNFANGSDYTNFRQRNESSRITSCYNIEVKARVKNLAIGTGLSYLSKGQKLDNGSNPATLIYQLYDSIPYIDINGNLTYLPFNYRDTSIQGNFTSPSYHYINVPLKLGKTFQINKLSIDVFSELTFGYLLSASGNSLNYAIKPTSIDASRLNRFNLGAGASVGLNYKLQDNISLNVNAKFNTDLNNTLKQTQTSQRLSLYGMGIGVFYSINKK